MPALDVVPTLCTRAASALAPAPTAGPAVSESDASSAGLLTGLPTCNGVMRFPPNVVTAVNVGNALARGSLAETASAVSAPGKGSCMGEAGLEDPGGSGCCLGRACGGACVHACVCCSRACVLY